MIKNELNGRSRGGTMNILESFEYDENNRLVKWTNLVTTGVQKVIDYMLGRFILMTRKSNCWTVNIQEGLNNG